MPWSRLALAGSGAATAVSGELYRAGEGRGVDESAPGDRGERQRSKRSPPRTPTALSSIRGAVRWTCRPSSPAIAGEPGEQQLDALVLVIGAQATASIEGGQPV